MHSLPLLASRLASNSLSRKAFYINAGFKLPVILPFLIAGEA